jgi:hypothetical protein
MVNAAENMLSEGGQANRNRPGTDFVLFNVYGDCCPRIYCSDCTSSAPIKIICLLVIVVLDDGRRRVCALRGGPARPS